MKVSVDGSLFRQKLKDYIRLSGKGVAVSLTEQSRLTADRLTKLTYPAKAAEGKRRVEIDINRVYLKNEWFSETFQFRNRKLQESVTEAVDRKDALALEQIFDRSSRLRKLQIQPFSQDAHNKVRDRRGRVRSINPFSFPLKDQTAKRRYLRDKQKNVGGAKRGFARCVERLGGRVPGWLTGGDGSISDHSKDSGSPYITLINRVPYAAGVVQRGNVIQRALSGRARDMEKALLRQLNEAKKRAGFN